MLWFFEIFKGIEKILAEKEELCLERSLRDY